MDDPQIRRLAELRDCRALSPQELRTLANSGSIVRVRRGVYAQPGDRDARQTYRLQITAAAASSHPDLVVSHWSAALMWDLPLWRRGCARVWLSRDADTHGRVRNGLHLYRASLAPDEIVAMDGLAVTSIARTVIDVARTAPYEWGVIVADHALHERLCTLDELMDALARAVGRRGTGRARRVLEFADARAESPLESLSRVQIAGAGLPTPDLQVPIYLHGALVGIADFAWDEFRTIGECDGASKYGELLAPDQTPTDAVMAEKDRENRIHQARWWTTRWGWADACNQTHLARRIRDAFANAPWRAQPS